MTKVEKSFLLEKKRENMRYFNYTHVFTGVPLTKEEQIQMARNRMSINHASTRLQVNPFDEQASKETVQDLAKTAAISSLSGKIGVDGKEITLNSTPRVNGFSYVKTPSPAPGMNSD